MPTRRRRYSRGFEAYHADWKAERQAQSLRPVHDWSSHGADAFQYLAQGLPGLTALTPRPRVTVPQVQYSFTTPARRAIGPGPGGELAVMANERGPGAEG